MLLILCLSVIVVCLLSSVDGLIILPNHTQIQYEGRYNDSDSIVQFDMPGFCISFRIGGVQNVSVLL